MHPFDYWNIITFPIHPQKNIEKYSPDLEKKLHFKGIIKTNKNKNETQNGDCVKLQTAQDNFNAGSVGRLSGGGCDGGGEGREGGR